MGEAKNLWPKELLSTFDIVLPITILQEQASFFNDMTKNVVTASIDTQKISVQSFPELKGLGSGSGTNSAIVHVFKISAPSIGNYDFDLLHVIQEDLLPYPLKVISQIWEDKAFDAKDGEQLKDILEKIFNEKKVITIVQSLILQSM